jgi:hypothetical protein
MPEERTAQIPTNTTEGGGGEDVEDMREYISRIKQSIVHHREESKRHAQLAEQLLEEARNEGVIIQLDDDETNQLSGPGRGKRIRKNRGQGRVIDPKHDHRLAGNETPALAAARHNEQGDDRGKVKDPQHDKRLAENVDD